MMYKIKKLKLKKEIIANLNNDEMTQIKGGADSYYDACTGDCASGACTSKYCPPTSKCPSVTCVPTTSGDGGNPNTTYW